MPELERRTISLSETRATGQTTRNPRTIAGRAIVYNGVSADLGGFVETFKPGSARLSPDLLILCGHDAKQVLGRTSSGTARAWDDGRGILFEATLPDTTYARDLAVIMSRGDVYQMSFAFRVPEGGDYWYFDHALNTSVREVYSAIVSELSVVSMPAYLDTEAAVT